MSEYYPKQKKERPVPSSGYMQPFIYGILLASGIMMGYFLRKPVSGRFNELFNLVERHYVDTVNMDRLEDRALNSFLKTLDPHSSFIPASEVKGVKESLEGSFEGIGVQYNIFRDTVTIMYVIKNGPSEHTGLRIGDKIIEVDGKKVAGMGIKDKEIVSLLKGPKNTSVTIKIKRRGSTALSSYTITRGVIPLVSVDAGYKIDDHTGYIKINRFSAGTVSEFKEVMERLKKEGIDRLVLDLRDNPGGYLQAATELLDEFLPDKKLMVYTEGNRENRVSYKSRVKGSFEQGDLVVLVNEHSASASEIMAGSLQDNDRAAVIGRRTFGKGLVQESYMLSDGSQVRLTIARYYMPSGRNIQRPYREGYDAYEEDELKRYSSGELQHDSLFRERDTVVYRTVSGRRVYGGSGVKPDVFVPMDTTDDPYIIRQLSRKGVFQSFIVENPEWFGSIGKKYSSYRDFTAQYHISAQVSEAFIVFARALEVDISATQMATYGQLVERELKSLLARQFYGEDAYYYVVNQDDDVVNTAMQNFRCMEALLRP